MLIAVGEAQVSKPTKPGDKQQAPIKLCHVMGPVFTLVTVTLHLILQVSIDRASS